MGAEETKPTTEETQEPSRLQDETSRVEMADVSFGVDSQLINTNNDARLNSSTSTPKQDCFLEIQAVSLLLKRKQEAPIYATKYGEAAVEEARSAAQQASQSAMIARMFAQMSDLGDLVKNASVDGANWVMAKKKDVVVP